jgi:hypothetical protein
MDGGSWSSSRWPSGAGSQNGVGGVEGVLERWQRCRHGGGGGGEGVPAVAVCEANKIFPCDSGQKAGVEFIVSSIKIGYTWNRYQQWFIGKTVVDISISTAVVPMNRC